MWSYWLCREGRYCYFNVYQQSKECNQILERVAGCKFEFVNPPAIEEVLESSAEQMVATLEGVQPESSQFFAPSAQKLIEEQRRSALPTRLGHLSKN
jgi:hypothetical protein